MRNDCDVSPVSIIAADVLVQVAPGIRRLIEAAIDARLSDETSDDWGDVWDAVISDLTAAVKECQR